MSHPRCPGLDVIITRHRATAAWLTELLRPQGRRIVQLHHLPTGLLERRHPAGRCVDWRAVRFFGNLPHALSAAVCAQGAEFWSVEVGPLLSQRGQELAPTDLCREAPRLVRYVVQERCLLPRSGFERSTVAATPMRTSFSATLPR